MKQKILNIDRNAKTVKGHAKGYMTGILYLAPANLSGYEVCPNRSKGCTMACLNTAGRGQFSTTQAARIKKTKAYFEDRAGFCAQLDREIKALAKKAGSLGFVPCIRLNGTSDLAWESISTIMQDNPGLQFYDYTKSPSRMLAFLDGSMPVNYHLTFSASENNQAVCKTVLDRGGNVAMVFSTKRGHALGQVSGGAEVLDGDESDLRFLDRPGCIVGLRAKGRARRGGNKFVMDLAA